MAGGWRFALLSCRDVCCRHLPAVHNGGIVHGWPVSELLSSSWDGVPNPAFSIPRHLPGVRCDPLAANLDSQSAHVLAPISASHSAHRELLLLLLGRQERFSVEGHG